MGFFEALILGIIQGLTEFLPISSSGHLEIAKALLNIEAEESLIFTVVVHGATVLSTIVVFYKDILQIITRSFSLKLNEENSYIFKLIISMIPVAIVGLFFKDVVESFFTGNVLLVGSMLLVTSLLLFLTMYVKKHDKNMGYANSLIVGIAQAIAVIPGISRSGSTIATGLLLGIKKEVITKFSFLMVLVPIIGANVKDLMDGEMIHSSIDSTALIVGFIAAFLSGIAACKLMIKIVAGGKLTYFAIYCLVIGVISIIASFIA